MCRPTAVMQSFCMMHIFDENIICCFVSSSRVVFRFARPAKLSPDVKRRTRRLSRDLVA